MQVAHGILFSIIQLTSLTNILNYDQALQYIFCTQSTKLKHKEKVEVKDNWYKCLVYFRSHGIFSFHISFSK